MAFRTWAVPNTLVVTDFFKRAWRLFGDDVFFLTGHRLHGIFSISQAQSSPYVRKIANGGDGA
jgi:methionyl-tRNA synthetase